MPLPQRKQPVRRAFSGLAGSPFAQIQHTESGQSPGVETVAPLTQPHEIVANLIEAVAAANTEEKVKQALQNAFSPVTPTPIKRGRGRPRKYAGTVRERDAERKRIERTKAKEKLAIILLHFGLDLDSSVAPELKTRYGVQVNTYRELFDSDSVVTLVIKEIAKNLKMFGTINTPPTSGKYLTDAPQGRGKLTYLGKARKAGEVYDIRKQRERELSRPEDPENDLIPASSLDAPPMGDRRRGDPEGHGPDAFEDSE